MVGGGQADLHVHTTASDGTLTPEQVVREAARIGLAAVGITDHDSVDGIKEAVGTGKTVGIKVVPGIEINTDVGNEEVHILGYFIDDESVALRRHLENLRQGRLDRAKKIVERLNKLGVNISFDDVLKVADKGSVGRPHIARAIVNAGYADSPGDAFGRYLARGAPAYIPRYKVSPFEALHTIKEALGVPVFAHPGTSKHDELIPQLVEVGLKGIEVYHPEHSPAQTEHYLRIAEKYNLIATGGSDSHGPNMIKTVPIGYVTVDVSVAYELEELAGKLASSRG
ncbi:MAG: PHP domain-containing protein [Armatimonadota bacterium]|nr:PHP domain-containing protein [Armatimonadota bacterium]